MSVKDCIFCGAKGGSKEHIIADWLKNFIPKTNLNYESLKGTVHTTHTDEKLKTRGGDFYSRTVRCVCDACNNGWMAKIQDEVKPIVTQMLKGDLDLTDEQQAVLAKWIAMAVICSEYDHPDMVTVTQQQREMLYKSGIVPDGFRIWIGNFNRVSWPAHWVHHPVAIEKMPLNTQTTTYTVGQIFIHVMSSSTYDVNKWKFKSDKSTGIRQLWPITESPFNWSSKHTLEDANADAIANDLFAYVKSLGQDPKNIVKSS
jgi:hypothetical protein